MPDFFKPELDRVVPNWAAPERIRAFFTCRSGGVSSGPYGSAEGIMGLNLAFHTGDVPSCVRMNRQILCGMLPAEPKWLAQVHGTEVLDADRIGSQQGPWEADAAISTTEKTVLCVMTADCLPVLLADAEGRGVAAVHAGWRSLADGIIQKTAAALVDAVKAKHPQADAPVRLLAWLGPRIGADAFEVGGDVLEAMRRHLPDAAEAFAPKGEGKYLADLGRLAVMALGQAGAAAADIADCGLSTYGDPEKFYSFRRDGEKSGRHAAVIWME